MATNTLEAKAHELLGQLPSEQLAAIVRLLEAMVREDQADELTEEDRRAVAASREYFEKGGEGISFEQLAAECGLDPDQIRATDPGHKASP
jgi:hypothetical protein